LEAVVVGIGVCAIWVGLDGFYPKLGKTSTWNPPRHFGEGAGLVVRGSAVVGSSLVVPRWKKFLSFLSIPLHREPISCQFPQAFRLAAVSGYGGGVRFRTPRAGQASTARGINVVIQTALGDAMTAHAITVFCRGFVGLGD
jgi:hypothetical protein